MSSAPTTDTLPTRGFHAFTDLPDNTENMNIQTDFPLLHHQHRTHKQTPTMATIADMWALILWVILLENLY